MGQGEGVAPGPNRSLFKQISGTLKAPWEIGRAQGQVVRLADEGVFDGCDVLDVGCCIGDNSVYVARRAKSVMGCDLVERALNVAREKAAAAGLTISFVQQDLIAPLQGELQGRQFDVILDSAVYHVLPPGPARDAYLANIEQLVKPGGRIVLLCFSDKEPGTQGPVRVTQADIHASYPPPMWKVESIEDVLLEGDPKVHEGGIAKAYLAIIWKNA